MACHSQQCISSLHRVLENDKYSTIITISNTPHSLAVKICDQIRPQLYSRKKKAGELKRELGNNYMYIEKKNHTHVTKTISGSVTVYAIYFIHVVVVVARVDLVLVVVVSTIVLP